MLMLAGLATVGFVFWFLLFKSEHGPKAHGLETSRA
jgi:hypothetical protein